MIDFSEIIGFIAGFCTTIAFLPQILKIIRTKATQDISLAMYIILCTGLIFWIFYGVMTDSYSIITANSITLLLAIATIVMKIKWK